MLHQTVFNSTLTDSTLPPGALTVSLRSRHVAESPSGQGPAVSQPDEVFQDDQCRRRHQGSQERSDYSEEKSGHDIRCDVSSFPTLIGDIGRGVRLWCCAAPHQYIVYCVCVCVCACSYVSVLQQCE